MFTFQADRCYPQSEASVINTVGTMNTGLIRGGSPNACYDWCVDNTGTNTNNGVPIDYMGLQLEFTHKCMCNRPSAKARESETNIRFARRQSRQG